MTWSPSLMPRFLPLVVSQFMENNFYNYSYYNYHCCHTRARQLCVQVLSSFFIVYYWIRRSPGFSPLHIAAYEKQLADRDKNRSAVPTWPDGGINKIKIGLYAGLDSSVDRWRRVVNEMLSCGEFWIEPERVEWLKQARHWHSMNLCRFESHEPIAVSIFPLPSSFIFLSVNNFLIYKSKNYLLVAEITELPKCWTAK